MLTAHRPLEQLVAFPAFEQYAHALVRSRDVDPVYDLVPAIIEHEHFEPEWFVYVYVAYYSLHSAVRICRLFPRSADFEPLRYLEAQRDIRTFGVERRGANRMAVNIVHALEAWVDTAPAIRWQQSNGGNRAFRTRLEMLPMVGPWAAFKLAELHEKALGHPNLAPEDMGINERDVNSSRGPQGGCRALYSRDPGARFAPAVRREWEALGVTLTRHLGYDLGKVETCLCKWSKVVKGQYFVGHDVHELGQLADLWAPDAFAALMHRARLAPTLWADPLNVRQARRAYRDRGVLLNARFAHLPWPL